MPTNMKWGNPRNKRFPNNRVLSDYTKLSMLAFLYYLNLKIKVDTVVRHIYFGSKHHVKWKFAPKFIHLITITNLLPFEVVQKYQFASYVYYRKTRMTYAYLPRFLHIPVVEMLLSQMWEIKINFRNSVFGILKIDLTCRSECLSQIKNWT